MAVDEWDDGVEATCDHCGETRICIESSDPYVEELHPDSESNTSSFWCRACYRKAIEEI